MRYLPLIIVAGALSACSAGGGTYDGVPLEANETTSCTTPGGVITSSGESARQNLIRCAPQSQPLAGS